MPTRDQLKPLPPSQTPQDLLNLIPHPENGKYRFFEHAAENPFEATLDFRLVNAWWLADLSFLTYASPKQFAIDRVKEAGFTGAEGFGGFDNSAPPHVLIAHNASVILVAFRGTSVSDLSDILADIDLAPTLALNGVHRGFQRSLGAGGFWNQAKQHIAAIRTNQLIYFTGHSLGAALATLAAHDFEAVTPAKHCLYTYGSPRVGNVLYGETYRPASYRIVNERDVVTQVPTPPLYDHIGHALGTDGSPLPQSLIATALQEASQVAHLFTDVFASKDSRAQNLREHFAVSKPLADHSPERYAKKIWNALIPPGA